MSFIYHDVNNSRCSEAVACIIRLDISFYLFIYDAVEIESVYVRAYDRWRMRRRRQWYVVVKWHDSC